MAKAVKAHLEAAAAAADAAVATTKNSGGGGEGGGEDGAGRAAADYHLAAEAALDWKRRRRDGSCSPTAPVGTEPTTTVHPDEFTVYF